MNKEVLEEVKNLIKLKKLDINLNQNEEKIREEFKDKVDWFYISSYQTLSECFIREFKDKVIWYDISRYQNLLESFIREFKDNVDWFYISVYQTLSEPFIREFKNKVDWYWINENSKIIKTEKLQDMINCELLIMELK